MSLEYRIKVSGAKHERNMETIPACCVRSSIPAYPRLGLRALQAACSSPYATSAVFKTNLSNVVVQACAAAVFLGSEGRQTAKPRRRMESNNVADSIGCCMGGSVFEWPSRLLIF